MWITIPKALANSCVAEMRGSRVANPNVHELNIQRTDRTEGTITELQELTNFTKNQTLLYGDTLPNHE